MTTKPISLFARLAARAAVLAALASPLLPALAPSAAAQGAFYETWLCDRLTVGLGFGASTLTDNHRRADKEDGLTYIGFVNELEDVKASYFFPEVGWWAAHNLRLLLSWDHVEGHTRNYNNRHSDGTVRLRGPLLEAQLIFPMLHDTLFPRVGVGAAWETSKFRAERWWRLGYYSREEYEAAGAGEKSHGGYFRAINVDNDVAWSLSGGVSWRPTPRLQLDATLRHVWIEPECEYGEYRVKNGYQKQFSGKFWMDHLTASVSASYVF